MNLSDFSEFVKKENAFPMVAGLLFMVVLLMPFFMPDNHDAMSDIIHDGAAYIDVLNTPTEEANLQDLLAASNEQKEAVLEQNISSEQEAQHSNDMSDMHVAEDKHEPQKDIHKSSEMMDAEHMPAEEASVAETTAHEALPDRVCYEVGPVQDEVQKNELESIFRSHNMIASLKFQNVEKELGYWVYLPPERSLALGRLKVEEIKLKGIKDVNLLVNHEPKLAISLGIFKDQANANKRLLKAQSLGFEAKMEIRSMEENQMWLVLESARETDLSEQEWANLLQQFKPIELKTTICF